MGGDHAPAMVVAGLEIAAERHPAARFLLVGDEAGWPRCWRSPPRGAPPAPCGTRPM